MDISQGLLLVLNFLAISLNNFVFFLHGSALVLLLMSTKKQLYLNVLSMNLLIMFASFVSFYIALMCISHLEKNRGNGTTCMDSDVVCFHIYG